jgi:aminoglycoside 6'-N-acetyltransferase
LDADSHFLGERVGLRPLVEADAPLLARMFALPSVAQWWARISEDDVRAMCSDHTAPAFAVVLEGAVVGLVQYHEERDPQYRHAGIDIAIDPDAQGRGIGTDAVRTMARYLVDVRGHHRLTIDPAADNERAIACYRRVGFRAVGVMREYEQAPDGTWRDGLLMELLAGDLR